MCGYSHEQLVSVPLGPSEGQYEMHLKSSYLGMGRHQVSRCMKVALGLGNTLPLLPGSWMPGKALRQGSRKKQDLEWRGSQCAGNHHAGKAARSRDWGNEARTNATCYYLSKPVFSSEK